MKWFNPASLALAAVCSSHASASTFSIVYDARGEAARTYLQAPVPVAGGRIIGESFGYADLGKIYELAPGLPGKPYTKSLIHFFARDDHPSGNLTPDASGNLWGTTNGNGANNNGWLFELIKPAVPTDGWRYHYVLALPASFGTSNLNFAGYGNLIFDKSGNLFGLSIGGTVGNGCVPAGCNVIWEIPAGALAGGRAPITTLLTIPTSSLVATSMIRDAKGNFFAVGNENTFPGVVWEASAGTGGAYAVRTIHTFCSIRNSLNQCVDGDRPTDVVITPNGTLFGTTIYAGTDPGITNCCGGTVAGIVFQMHPTAGATWTFAVVHNFLWERTDGIATADAGVGSATGLTLQGNHLLITAQQGGSPDCIPGVTQTYPRGCSAYEGGLLSVTVGTGDKIINNAFDDRINSTPIAGPSGPLYRPILGSSGAVLGAVNSYYTPGPSGGYSLNGLIYKITP